MRQTGEGREALPRPEKERRTKMVYKPENPGTANVWYYVMKINGQFPYLLMAHNVAHNADRIIRGYKTLSAITAARKLNLKTGAERG